MISDGMRKINQNADNQARLIQLYYMECYTKT